MHVAVLWIGFSHKFVQPNDIVLHFYSDYLSLIIFVQRDITCDVLQFL